MKALVVFAESTDHPLGRLLRPGFRHCFCAIEQNGLWIEIDGREGIPCIRYMAEADFDLAKMYRDEGHTVIETEQGSEAVFWPLTWRNCVGLVKATLCLKTWAVTPYGLYKYLLMENRTCN